MKKEKPVVLKKNAEKSKNKVVIPKKFVDKNGNKFFMEVYDKEIVLKPRKKGEENE